MDEATWAAFEELYGALPRQGPGDEEATLAALALVPNVRGVASVLDAGSGSGASTLVLAKALPDAQFVAVDVSQPLLERLERAAEELGALARIQTRCGSMLEPSEDGLDLVWCEGAIYNVGIEAALDAWAGSLGPGAAVVFSEACWFVEAAGRDPEAVAFWKDAYPQMDDEKGVRARVESLGYQVVGARRLPRLVWMDSYYDPLARRCDALRPGAKPAMLQVIAMAEREIEMFRRFGEQYGYTYFVVTRR